MNKSKLIQYFEKTFLKGTCFNTFNELMKDETNFQVNIVRVLIAVELKGVWRGLNEIGRIK